MAIIKQMQLGTGHTAEYWALAALEQITPNVEQNQTTVIGSYNLWATKQAREDGFGVCERVRRIQVVIPGLDPRLSDIEAAMDAELLREPVPAVDAVASVAAQPAALAVHARPRAGRMPPVPAVLARPAVEAVQGVVGVPSKPGGALFGGKRA